ncbi:hypothetical protein IFM89_019429 [Coptis chinensis]|uniref:C2H2-type domain-containing protein n=1 Tax=Coptis chinensis TaxID=261450 RepID=A0A835HBV9_9MAGN|nr:hypothetical protein IFM89_019429 [Coptis chinensis]
MDMEVVEETMGSNDQVLIIKGRRTKRPRPSSPFSLASSSSVGGISSGSGGAVIGGDGNGHANNLHDEFDRRSSSPINSVGFAESTEEEEDMANCLILLAHGGNNNKNEPSAKHFEDDGGMERYNRRKIVDTATTTGKAGLYEYQCKTCNRCFASFQALGGHRASHKKPKNNMVEDQKKAIVSYDDHEGHFNNNSPPLHMGNRGIFSNNKSKVHECSICGSEFSSGQALGGHMRRHRTPTNTNMAMTTHVTTSESQEYSKKSRNVLALDLNLPAPEEERENKFSYASPFILSASPLVDCHY